MKHGAYRTALGGLLAAAGVFLVTASNAGQPLLPPTNATMDTPGDPLVSSIESLLFSMMPVEAQAQIAVAEFSTEADRSFDAPFDVTDKQFALVAHVMTREVFEGMRPAHRRVLLRMAEQAARGESRMAACFAPGTDPAFAHAVSEVLYEGTPRFNQTTRWTNTATDGGGLGQGTPTTITYSYVPDGTSLSGSPSNSQLFAWLNSVYGNPATWQPLFDQVFDRWEELTGVTYVYEPNDDGITFGTSANRGLIGVRGDVRIGAIGIDGNFGILAFNDFPNNGDMVFDAFDNFYNITGNNSRRLRNVIAHEHGHGLGMLHVCPQNSTKLMEPSASTAFDGPQLDDILNGQRHYGDPLEANGPVIALGEVGFPGLAITQLSIDDNSDTDIFTVDVPSPSEILITATPTGATYLSGVQTQACNNGSNFNSQIIHDLKISLFDINGATLLGFADNGGDGVGEFLTVQVQNPGSYFVWISGDDTNNVQLYSFTATVTELPDLSCNDADLAEPLGVLDFSDVVAFLSAFGAMDSDADLAPPFGVYDFSDVVAFLSAFGAGCP